MDHEAHKTVLLLTGPMGSGHVRAALAVKEALHRKFPGVRVLYADTTGIMPPLIRWVFLGLYPFLLAFLPFVWRLIHGMNNRSGRGFFTLLFDCFDGGVKEHLRELVERNRVDLIICTHFYPGYVVDKMKRERILTIPSTLVITDHTGHRIYARREHDRIFAPNPEAMEQLVVWGVPKEQIRIAGCPVFAKFSQTFSDGDLNRFREELNLRPNLRYVMLTMGGWAVGNMVAEARSILQADREFGLLVMTAHNRKLFRQFSRMAQEDDRIVPVAYTDQIEKYMAVCSFVITKPGGITTSECIAMQKPMLLVEPIAGHEEENMRYLTENGLAFSRKPGESLPEAALRMKAHQEQLISRMKKYADTVRKVASQIAEESMSLVPAEEE